MTDAPGTLNPDEPHPAAYEAKRWIQGYAARHEPHKLYLLLESFASNAIEGNRTAEVCGETLWRLLSGEPVSDRYVLGLAWVMRNMEEMEDD